MTDLPESCPSCGALPVDWVDNPFRTTAPDPAARMPRRQSIRGMEREPDGKAITFHFALVPTRAEVINTWLRLRDFVPPDYIPAGWEPSSKDAEFWEQVS